jgi:hypothetical protein
MIEIANNLLEVIKDYRNDDGFEQNTDRIISWANQFGENAEFVLREVSHIIPQVYISKAKAKDLIFSHVKKLMRIFRYESITRFLADTEFLDLQPPHKSQKAILILLDEVLTSEHSESLEKYRIYPKINFVYFDDVLATGSTIGKDLVNWLSSLDANGVQKTHHLLSNKYKLSVNLFCLHTWGHSFQRFRLKKEFEDKIDSKIYWICDYKVENHAKWNNQSLNVAFPLEEQLPKIKAYLANLTASKYEDYAYRKSHNPTNEKFFTSSENRIIYENLLLEKGISIIEMIKGEIKLNIRPLGLINPNYKTFGLGTHFFTWRNIPNNSPLVFWWEVPGHNWIPLFPVVNRGT